ncbi:unnamed protein product, partial [marine sediment metagenome]
NASYPAVIYPIKPEHISRFFSGKSVFVKFLQGESTRLIPGSKLVLYKSRSEQTVVGDANITKIEFIEILDQNNTSSVDEYIYLEKVD